MFYFLSLVNAGNSCTININFFGLAVYQRLVMLESIDNRLVTYKN